MQIDKFEIDLAIDTLIANPNSVEGLERLRRVLYLLALGAYLDDSISNDTNEALAYLGRY